MMWSRPSQIGSNQLLYLARFDNDHVMKSEYYLLNFVLSSSYFGCQDASFQSLFYIF